ncbi:MAG: alpha/beta hydrolase-fold protein [Anaerolineae bacterium]|nr:alpha/beta hydrolase-fold protein [Anaerolineae bacterium]MCO5188609.1 alpha/beta hydrolase-fold protein [Anaerolineae bacterium]MCO5193399.1 alpha/beta hydrolase-fold protein [Anaerolineae bacterium]MCO5198795.1 alpha/beta hydrolase-fold protein [Anaerolineae bacterium]MCO5205537.1 alpha/beta hydrolase-fold protein [Anaerolineae bacterium]
MKREYHRWHSPSLERNMELLVLGHAGARVLVFPTSKGRYYEWEDRQMFRWDVLGEQIERGWLQIFCVDSVDAESWYAHDKWPGDRAWRQTQYDNYLRYEVLPFMHSLNRNPFLITLGASFGAYHAMNFGLRHPHLTGRILGLSGIYSIDRWTSGHIDEHVHNNNPMAFVSAEHDHNRLEAMRHIDIIIVSGRDDTLHQNSQDMSRVLWQKGIGNALRAWDGWAHDWPYWEQMIKLYIGGHD